MNPKKWDKKVYSYNYYDLKQDDKRKSELDKFFVGRTRPVQENKTN